MSTVNFEFDPFDRVLISGIDAEGFVTSRMANIEGRNEYKVTYWYNGDRKECWFFEHELGRAS